MATEFSSSANSTFLECRSDALASPFFTHRERVNFCLSDRINAENKPRRPGFFSDRLNAEPEKSHDLIILQSYEKLARQILGILAQNELSLLRSSLLQTFQKLGPARVLFGPLLNYKG